MPSALAKCRPAVDLPAPGMATRLMVGVADR